MSASIETSRLAVASAERTLARQVEPPSDGTRHLCRARQSRGLCRFLSVPGSLDGSFPWRSMSFSLLS